MVSTNGDTYSCTSRVSLEKLNKNLHRHLRRVAPACSPVGWPAGGTIKGRGKHY